MDRAVGSATSQTNSSANNTARQQAQNQFRSALVRVAASTGNLMGMNLLPVIPNSNQENRLNAQQGGNKGLANALAKITTSQNVLVAAKETSGSRDHFPKLVIPAQTTDGILNYVYQELNNDSISPKHMSTLQKLNELVLRNCTGLSSGLIKKLIAHCTSLKTLNLTGCQQLSGADLTQIISMLDKVESLDLSGFSQLNEKVAEKLPDMFNLRHLVLRGCTKLTSQAFGELVQLRKLVTLNLDGCTQLSNTELLALEKLKHLNYLDVRNCPSVTENGIKALARSMPWLQVVCNDFSTFARKSQFDQGGLKQAKKTRLA